METATLRFRNKRVRSCAHLEIVICDGLLCFAGGLPGCREGVKHLRQRQLGLHAVREAGENFLALVEEDVRRPELFGEVVDLRLVPLLFQTQPRWLSPLLHIPSMLPLYLCSAALCAPLSFRGCYQQPKVLAFLSLNK